MPLSSPATDSKCRGLTKKHCIFILFLFYLCRHAKISLQTISDSKGVGAAVFCFEHTDYCSLHLGSTGNYTFDAYPGRGAYCYGAISKNKERLDIH